MEYPVCETCRLNGVCNHALLTGRSYCPSWDGQACFNCGRIYKFCPNVKRYPGCVAQDYVCRDWYWAAIEDVEIWRRRCAKLNRYKYFKYY